MPKDEVSKLQKLIIILSNLIHDIVFCLAFFSSWIMQPSFMVATDFQTELNLPQWLTMNVSVKAVYYSFCRSQHNFFLNPLTVECGSAPNPKIFFHCNTSLHLFKTHLPIFYHFCQILTFCRLPILTKN